MFSKFLLGQLHFTEEVVEVLERTPLDLVARHAVCDFGLATPRQTKANSYALREGGEIRSEYLIDPTHPERGRVTVVTKAGWGETKVAIKPQPRGRATGV